MLKDIILYRRTKYNKMAADLYTFIAELRRDVDTDDGNGAILETEECQIMFKNINWLATNKLSTSVQRKDKQHWLDNQLNRS